MSEKSLPTKGMHEIKFKKDLGSYKKDDVAVYHASTASNLAKKGLVEIVKEIKEYYPPKAKK